MPSYLTDAEVDEGRLGEALNAAPSGDLTLHTVLGMGQLTPMAGDFLHGLATPQVTGLTAEQANRDYGVDGYLKFEQATTNVEAARKSATAHRRAFTEDVLGRAKLNPLAQIGGAMVGGLLDPVGLPLFAVPEILGLRAGIEGAVASRGVFAGAGRLANAGRGALVGAGEGLAGTAIYESANYGLRRYSGEDDYGLGDSLVNLLLGGVLGAGIGGAVGGLLGDAHPRAVRDLPEPARRGAAALALDDAMAERPVDVAGLIARETEARTGPASLLDEAGAEPTIRAKPLDDASGGGAVAVTTRGTEIPVRYAIVELSDLTTSHDDDLVRNAKFPEGLQPRDRTRAGSQAGNLRLEAELNPKRLMRETGAETGAPIVAPDGTVESGNGRTIALRRSAERGTPAWGNYQAELAAQGFDVAGFERPVLVRLRTQAMSGERRAALAREMNADATERMGASEQAMADAQRLDPATLAALSDDGKVDASFSRAFIARVAPDQQNAFADAAGRLSPEGGQRIKAALVAHAYEDPRLVAALFEGDDAVLKGVGEALGEAAPRWAKMRALAAAGEIPPELDITPQLAQAVALIREAKATRRPLAELVEERSGAADLFDAERDVTVADLLAIFYRDEAFTKPRAADKAGWALNDYARQAMAVEPGPKLFGDETDAARRILDHTAAQFAGKAPFPTRAERVSPPKPQEPVVVDLAPVGGREGQAAADAVGPPGPGDLWRLSPDELEALLAEKGGTDEEKLLQALGGEEQVREFKRLDRMRNSSDPARADEGARLFDEKFGKLTPEQERLIYGIGETEAQAAEIKQVLDAHGDVVEGDPSDWAAYMAAVSARRVPVAELAKVPSGEGSAAAQAAFVRMQKAYEVLTAGGTEPNRIPDMMAEALVNRAGWTPEQAAEIVGGFVDDLAAARQPPAAKAAAPKALAAPKPKADPLAGIDEELKALAEQDLADAGAAPPAQDPATIAEAIRAAAFCLSEG